MVDLQARPRSPASPYASLSWDSDTKWPMGLCMPMMHTSRGRALGTEDQGTRVTLLSRT